MDTNPLSLGKSLLVPSVQELAKQPLTTIPPRYNRCDDDQPAPTIRSSATNDDQHVNVNVANSEVDHLQVPVINMEGLVTGDSDELQKLHYACQDWGFFQLVNHGVSFSLVEKFISETHGFFNLPMEEKEKYWQSPGEVEGFGQSFVVSEEQKLDWCDIFFFSMLPEQLRKPHLFPKFPIQYRETVNQYSAAMDNLAKKIVIYMAKALKIDSTNLMEALFTEMHQAFRMNYYPPCPLPDKVIGLTPHSDAVGLTILLQLNEIQGLQIRKDGNWVPVIPLPNAFVVNIGDILEIVTNGIYRSIEHRAVVNASKERLSVAAFHSPGLGQEIGPLPGLVTPGNPAKFKRIGTADYFKELFSRELDGKSYLDTLRIDNDKDPE